MSGNSSSMIEYRPFLAVDLGGDLGAMCPVLCHNCATVGRERHRLVHLLLGLDKDIHHGDS